MLKQAHPYLSRLFRRVTQWVCLAEAALLVGLGLWYLVDVPTGSGTDVASGLPAGGYAKVIGLGAVVVALLLIGIALLLRRGVVGIVGFAVCWQLFQLVAGITLLGEPALTAAMVLAGWSLVFLAVAGLVSGVGTIATASRTGPQDSP